MRCIKLRLPVRIPNHCWLDTGLQFWHRWSSAVGLACVDRFFLLMISEFYMVSSILPFTIYFLNSNFVLLLITGATNLTLLERDTES